MLSSVFIVKELEAIIFCKISVYSRGDFFIHNTLSFTISRSIFIHLRGNFYPTEVFMYQDLNKFVW